MGQRRRANLAPILIVVAVILLFAATVPIRRNQSRVYAMEMAAIQNFKTICAAQAQYHYLFGQYARNLTELGSPVDGQACRSAAGLISAELASGIDHGYKVTLTGSPAGYIISAVPVKYPSTGRRSLYTDQTLVIREHFGPEPATAKSQELK
jgi:hypothetical protein